MFALFARGTPAAEKSPSLPGRGYGRVTLSADFDSALPVRRTSHPASPLRGEEFRQALSRVTGRLLGVQSRGLPIRSITLRQLLVRAGLDDAAIFHHQHQVGAP